MPGSERGRYVYLRPDRDCSAALGRVAGSERGGEIPACDRDRSGAVNGVPSREAAERGRCRQCERQDEALAAAESGEKVSRRLRDTVPIAVSAAGPIRVSVIRG